MEDIIVKREKYDDELSERITWTPQGGAKAAFKMRILTQSTQDKLIYKTTHALWIVFTVVLIMGLGITYVSVRGLIDPAWLKKGSSRNSPSVMLVFIGLILSGTGLLLLKYAAKQIVFDKVKKLFSKGKESIIFSDIHALQLLKVNQTNHELNLVINDQTRQNITTCPNYESLLKDAQTIAAFMNLPIWKGKVKTPQPERDRSRN